MGAKDTVIDYQDALDNRNPAEFNKLQENFQQTLEDLSGLEGLGKVILQPYRDGSIFGHLYGKMV